MALIGNWNSLKILRRTLYGLILDGGELGDVLLPKKFVPDEFEIDQPISVFLFYDSEDRLTATTQEPLGVVGDFVSLKLKANEPVGAFFDWGLDKDLFLPFSEQVGSLQVGKNYVVRIYLDNTGRICASMKFKKFLTPIKPKEFKPDQAVEIIVFQETELGFKVVVNGQHEGLLYRNEIFEPLYLGQIKKAFVKKVRDDLKLDLILVNKSTDSIDEIASKILDQLAQNKGFLPINDKSSSEEITKIFGVSRKKFKLALAGLYSKKIIKVSDKGIELSKKV